MKRILSSIILILAAIQASGAVRLPSVISDGMILQRNEPIKIWGWADADEKFEINWNGQTYLATAQHDGSWECTLPAMAAGGPFQMTVGEITLDDILIGDVFLCSGQSNMELPVRRVTDMFAEEIASYENPDIRHYAVPQTFDFTAPQEDTPEASWKPCTQENVMDFSALAYFFAKELHKKTGVPVGLVNASWGGTPVESWISEKALMTFPRHINEKRIYEDENYLKAIKELEGQHFYRWNKALYEGDPGYAGTVKWFEENYDDSAWKEVDMFSKDWGNDGLNPCGGSHWLRKDFKVKQNGFEYQIVLDKPEVNIASYATLEERNFKVKVKSNLPFSVELPEAAESWLSYEMSELKLDRGARPREVEVRFKWNTNFNPNSRDAVISFNPVNPDQVPAVKDDLNIKQEAAEEIEIGVKGDSLALIHQSRTRVLDRVGYI